MTPQSCLTCTFWERHRPDADFGTCKQICGIESTLSGKSKAYIFASFTCDPGAHFVVTLHTHKTFDCTHYSHHEEHKPNIVDVVRNATRAAHNLPPLERKD